MIRNNFGSSSPWEEVVGYSRAVRLGNIIEVSGTVAVDDHGMLVGGISVYEQAKYILSKIVAYIEKAGGTKADIVRTRMYVTDISTWKEAGRAHGECFRDIKPATSMVEVRALIAPEYLVEIEATAVLAE
jgi:enamine deaminase RidA (YjgF/YER057c/UK114 family)